MATSNHRIWWDQDVQSYRMVVPFNKEFNNAYNTLFPASERVFDFRSRSWTLTEKILPATVLLLEKMFGVKPMVITRGQTEQAKPLTKNTPIDTVIADFVKMIPYEAMQKAYRQASMMMHPDHMNGSLKTEEDKKKANENMSKMNACWQRLEQDFYKKGMKNNEN